MGNISSIASSYLTKSPEVSQALPEVSQALPEVSQALPEVSQALPEVSHQLTMPTCTDCGTALKHMEDTYCGLTCYGKWFIREQYMMEGQEPPMVQLEDGPVRLRVYEMD